MSKRDYLELEDCYDVFGIDHDLSWETTTEVTLALGVVYYNRFENEFGDDNIEDFFDRNTKVDVERLLKSAADNEVEFPIKWDRPKVEALRELLHDINYHKAAGDLIVFE